MTERDGFGKWESLTWAFPKSYYFQRMQMCRKQLYEHKLKMHLNRFKHEGEHICINRLKGWVEF